jgi:hypothetical protein
MFNNENIEFEVIFEAFFDTNDPNDLTC